MPSVTANSLELDIKIATECHDSCAGGNELTSIAAVTYQLLFPIDIKLYLKSKYFDEGEFFADSEREILDFSCKNLTLN
ncbi:Hypothetical predicted protein [Octopus vulgaris]|uniref:Uncharacterized protein n=1 Tax=Octopus vulgaris TaxID=6645 RepID=A0AA36F3E2_OCTVU|nr:Hypothetical predicted protein [Octopus vulgaris]